MQRRTFVGAASAAAAGAETRRPLKVDHWGPDYYGETEQRQLTDVLEIKNPFRWYAGPTSKVLAFEKEFAAHMGTKYALGVTSGTAALQVAMAALEIGPGDEVILPAWTW